MATRTLQPSELEIQREVEALRDIRRRSTTPGALTIDPDLPPTQAPPSPSQTYWANSAGDPSGSAHQGSALPRRRSSRRSASSSDDADAPSDDPFHLFWVPASLHPEIAPAEFRAFLKEHARAPPPSDEAGLFRSNSASSYASGSGLARRKSMLSRQYQPSENDDEEDEKIVPLKRSPSNAGRGPQLTIKDLEKLEELAEEASSSDDPSKFRSILRRSLSLNLSPAAALSHMEEMPDIADEADSPIIVPPPGQILRRAARTKIRKPGLPGDGGGHRFASTRRAQARAATTSFEPRSSSDRSSSDHGESVESVTTPPESVAASRDSVTPRPESYSAATLIIDAYAQDDDDESQPPNIALLETVTIDFQASPPSSPPQLPAPDEQAPIFEALDPMLLTPKPQQVTPQPSEPKPELEPAQIPLPITPPTEVPTPPAPQVEPTPVLIQAPVARLPLQPTVPTPAVTGPQRKEKDKKSGLFGKWGGDKASKKAQKNASSEKETGFFGSLFGSKKKQESEPISSATGREAAQALLGSSKSSKNHVPSTSPGLPAGANPNNYSRYPIHVERAIYRLSHIKLANPRRPLYEQVLISNLMFWYLGVINKAQSPTQQPNGQHAPNANQATAATGQANDADKEKEQREKEGLDRERLEREQRERVEREAEMKKKESGKRGSLTKAPPGGGRRVEKLVKEPQYEMQHRVMEQEYGSFAAQAQQGMQLARIHSAPAGAANAMPGQQQLWGASSSPQLAQPQPQSVIPNHVYNHDLSPSNRTAHSPPPRMTSPTHPPLDQRSRSPPAQNPHRPMNASRYSPNSSQENLAAMPNGRSSGRSLSATALPSAPMYQVNGRSRKGTSAHAAIPLRGKRSRSSEGRIDENGFEEEDVPLAVWQQQRRR